ncbi:MAG: hypothetical protein WC582_01615 [Patescibacteria group bacterium]
MSDKTINILRCVARGILIIIAAAAFIFALLSGAESGMMGIIKNSPNALPWLVLFILVFVAWKWEMIGGLVILFFGIFSFFFFHASGSLPVLLVVTLPLIILGILFIAISRGQGSK